MTTLPPPVDRATAALARAARLAATARELAAYQDEPAQMPAAGVGKAAYLGLGFEKRGERTMLAHLDRRVPFLVQRALYVDAELPRLPWVFVVTTSGCVLQGDRMALEIDLAPGAEAHVTTQAATKIHTMDANCAVQTQALTLGAGAYLEFLPDPLIPHRGSRFLTDTSIAIDPSATLLYAETLLPGRKHHHADESFGFDLYASTVAAARPDGTPLFTEKFVVEPRVQALRRAGAMGDFDVFGNVLLLTPREHVDRVWTEAGAGVDLAAGLAFGACRLPNDAGIVFKVLGRESHQVRRKIREFWTIARRAVLGAGVPPEFLWR